MTNPPEPTAEGRPLPLRDEGETLSSITPLLPDEDGPARTRLVDLAAELREASQALTLTLPGPLKPALADLVRAMNCYYSNLIEGHNTHPIDIEKALRQDFSQEPEKRNLQREAVAHVAVQHWIDTGGLVGNPLAPQALCEIHRRFCENLPAELLRLPGPDGQSLEITPGAFRTGYVQIGRHIPPSPGAVPRILAEMARLYGRNHGRTGNVIAIACAHHRLVYVHPFSDLNGRVARMVSHAMLIREAGSESLWSAARGLARAEGEYKRRLMAADEPRHGGADGRGTLSQARLVEFAEFFLGCCIDQARFMADLMRPKELRGRITGWAGREIAARRLPLHADRLLGHLLLEGTLERGELPGLLGLKDRQAREVSASLIRVGALASDSHRAPLRLAFPAALAPEWMPGLFPPQTSAVP